MRAPWRSQYAPLVAFIIIALFGGFALKASGDNQDEQLYRSQLASCRQANELRMESNRRISSHEADKNVLREFMGAARDAREAAWKRDHNMSDFQAYQQYGKLIVKLDKEVTFKTVALVDCNKAVVKP